MDLSNHNLSGLFEQLGLPSSEKAIDIFIEYNKGISRMISIDKARVWTTSQATFLRESLEQDSDWTDVIDQLDARLRS